MGLVRAGGPECSTGVSGAYARGTELEYFPAVVDGVCTVWGSGERRA